MSTNTENFKTEQKAKWADGKRANGANFAQLFDAIARLIDDEVTSVPATDIPTAIKEFLDNSDKYNNTDAVAKLKEFAKKPETLKEALDAVGALDASDATKTAIANALKALNPTSSDFLTKFEKLANENPQFAGGEDVEEGRILEAFKKLSKNFGNSGNHYVFLADRGEVKIWKYSENGDAEMIVNEASGVRMGADAIDLTGFAVPYVRGTINNASAVNVPTDLNNLWQFTTKDGSRYVYDNSAHTLTPAASLIG